MTVSVTANVGSNHKGRTWAQRKKFVPDNDTGAEFVPAHWADDGEPEEIAPGGSFSFGFADGDGYSVSIWSDAPDAEDGDDETDLTSGD